MTIKEALSREDRICHNLLSHKNKEAVRMVFAALRQNGIMYILVNKPPEGAQIIDTGILTKEDTD